MEEQETIAWLGPLGDRGGYGAVARNFVRGLREIGRPVRAVSWSGVHEDIGAHAQELLSHVEPDIRGDEDLVVVHSDPSGLAARIPEVRARYDGRIAACTIAETDRLPPEWADGYALAEEV